MFNFFKKDYRYYLEQGEKSLQQGRYVDAKYSFNDALAKIDTASNEGKIIETTVLNKISEINNALAEVNLREAECCISTGNNKKAAEHLHMVIELAEDVMLREKAEKLEAELGSRNDSHNLNNNNNSCSGCKPAPVETSKTSEDGIHAETHLSLDEKFELLINTLPAPLPERYAALGKEFAYAYVSIHDGDDAQALEILDQLHTAQENDIIWYERALISFRLNDSATCEELLKKAIDLNPHNPLCYIALVQLLVDAQRAGEAIPLLESMIASNLLPGQAHVILGDVYTELGEAESAIQVLSKGLLLPGMAREAAERLIPLLIQQNRASEAQYIQKQYLKKCC